MKYKNLHLIALSLVVLVAATGVWAQTGDTPKLPPIVPKVVKSGKNDVSKPLHQILPIPPSAEPGVHEIPIHPLPRKGPKASGAQELLLGPMQTDSVVQSFSGSSVMPSPLQGFEGISNADNQRVIGRGAVPPDTNGDVGINHYVQWVNLSFAIWDKNGTLLYGPAAGNTLWQGFGGPCEATNNGDPIVQYDQLADRWLMSQFAFPNGYYAGPFYQCIAVSQTGDPTGAWYRYEYKISDTKMNDYPKFGVWPDAYYMSVNQFVFYADHEDFAGPGVVAFEREKMLSGLPANMVYFDISPQYASLLPSDMDGFTLPPAGSPNYFVQVNDDGNGAWNTDRLMVFQFHVDWSNPSASTFSGPTVLDTAPFDSILCDVLLAYCVPQPGAGAKLEALSDRLMYRLAYRNFGDHESIVVNHTVDTNGADHAGIRWYEVRDPGGAPIIYQQGTYAPDSNHRWMGSMAMDKSGNIGLGFSISSDILYPSIRYAGRLSSDTLGILAQGENELMAGGGSQTGYSRWGDYSMMAVDPVDDCTFWFTSEYYAVTSDIGWQTRIGSFKFPTCTDGVPPTVSLTSPADGAIVGGTVTISASAADNIGVSKVEFYLNPATTNTLLCTDSTAPYECAWDTTTLTEGAYTLQAKAIDLSNAEGVSATVTVTVDNTPPSVNITYPGDGAVVSGAITVTANAGDAHGIALVEFYADTVLKCAGSVAPYECILDTTLMPDGRHTLIALATDRAGNKTVSSSVYITTNNSGGQNDTTPPTVSITYPNNGMTVYGIATVTALASDNVGLSRVEFYMDGVLQTTVYTSPVSWAWDTRAASNTTHTLTAKAYDGSGNVGNSAPVTVNISNGPDLTMTVENSPSSANAGGSFTGNATVSNIGKLPAGSFLVKFYLSTDSLVSTADMPLTGGAFINGLGADSTSSITAALIIPSDVPSGTYYFGACVDTSNTVSELSESNNCATAASQIQVTRPDLVETSISNPPSSITIGGNFSVTDTVVNQGNGPANNLTIKFYLSSDNVITTSDILLTGSRSVASLLSGQSSSGTTSVIIPSVLAGTYYLGVCADPGNSIVESSETNNCIASATQITITGPDLVETLVSGPVSANAGGSIAITDKVCNQGTDTNGMIGVSLYLSTDTSITTSDTYIGGRSINGGLAQGRCSRVSTTVTIPATLSPGIYYIGAIADVGNNVTETNEANNSLAGNTITIAPPAYADLAETLVSGPTSIATGGSIKITDKVCNQGDKSTGAFFVGLYLSADSTVTLSDIYLGSRYSDALAPGACSRISTTVTIPATVTSGAYYIGAYADLYGSEAEANETNNGLAGNKITINP